MSLYNHCVKHGKEYLLEKEVGEKNAPLTPANVAITSMARIW